MIIEEENNSENVSTNSGSSHLELMGEIVCVSRDKFHVQLDESETVVVAQLSGKMRVNKIRVLLGDRVQVKVSPYDLSKGFITLRE